jgi:predicted ATPase
VNAEAWRRVQELLEQALDQPEDQRQGFVHRATGSDHDLRNEVLSLLAAPDIEEIPSPWLMAVAGPVSGRFAPGDRVAGRYVVRGLLGEGGMGDVHDAFDDELAIPVALKVLRLAGRDADAARRLKLEGLLARAIWHPNVCRVYDVGHHRDGGEPVWFLTMERLEGGTLADRLRAQGRLPLAQVRQLAESMALGLGAAHRAGVIHRDFKPSNVILVAGDAGERAVVTDFGTAIAAEPIGGRAIPVDDGSIVGTPAYMAPEQVSGDAVGPGADIYALGVVLFEMVTGALPFAGSTPIETALLRLQWEAPSPREHVPDLDDTWESVIRRCLERDPARRFRRVEDVIDALAGRATGTRDGEAAHGVPTNLPSERDAFVGREDEIRELDRAAEDDARLVTLVGAGGMGKTRLAVHHAWRRLVAHPGGAWFADLTDARDADGIAAALAAALAVPLARGDVLAQLGHALAGRGRCLVILDNVEPVAEPVGAVLPRWMAAAPEVRWLVTSRRRLGLPGERLIVLDPLAIDRGIELFERRARALHPNLDLSGSEAAAVRDIVRLVDGMPLAIELAAARVRVMSIADIVSRMRSRFLLLAGGRHAHHETLAGTIDDSWELLRPWEQAAFAQCAVFEGGFTAAAAESVLDLARWPEAPWPVDVIRSLVDRSLVRTIVSDASGQFPEPRFGLYVSLQEYARARLSPGTARAAEVRHGAWFAGFGTTEAIEALEGPGGAERWSLLASDVENCLAACRRAMARGDGATVANAYRAAWAVIRLRGPYGPAVEMGRAALALPDLDDSARVVVGMVVAEAEQFAGWHDDAARHCEEAMLACRRLGDRFLEGRIRSHLGRIHHDASHREEARREFLAALDLSRAVGDRRGEAILLNALGMTEHALGRVSEARALHEAALLMARATGDRRTEGVTLSNLGILEQNIGEPELARRHFEEALAIHRGIHNRRSEGIVRMNLGSLATDLGLADEARDHLEAALLIARAMGSRRNAGIALTAIGELLIDMDRPAEARQQLEAALAIHLEVGDRGSEGVVRGNLARLDHREGLLDRACAGFESALLLHREVGDRRYEGQHLAALAHCRFDRGERDEAHRMLDEAELILHELEARTDLARLQHIRAAIDPTRSGH